MKKYNCVVSIDDKAFSELEKAKALGLVNSYRKFVSNLIKKEVKKMLKDNDIKLNIIENREFMYMTALGFVPVVELGEIVSWIKIKK